jgi:hypothetical protein
MIKVRMIAAAVIGIGSVVSIGGLAAGTAAVASTHASASWRIVKGVNGPDFPEFSAITVISSTNAWAFTSQSGSAQPHAFELTRGHWLQMAFPDRANEIVSSVSSSSASNIWAITQNFNFTTSKAYRFNGHKWARVQSFSRLMGSDVALSPTNVWLFGAMFSSVTQALHYNGHSFTASPGSRGLFGASALSANSIWAYGTTTVAHWNGHSWKSTSVAKQLPKNSELCSSRLSAIYAASAKNVYAAGTGGCQDQGGPFVLLHFNGRKWSRIELKQSLGFPEAMISDGKGGLWLPIGTGAPISGSMEHYGNGKLTAVALPLSPAHIVLFGAAIGKHTTVAYAVGFSRKSFSSSTSTAVILRYGP